MNIVRFPPIAYWDALIQRPIEPNDSIEATVSPILSAVKNNGNEAVLGFIEKFENRSVESFEVDMKIIENAEMHIPSELKVAIDVAYKNITTFHESQKETVKKVETMPGVTCWRKSVPIEKVGIYVPGGSAPLFSTVLMLGVPAQIAGCKEIVLCSPSDHPAIFYAAKLVGVTKVFRVGGAHAIAAMAFGTDTVPKCYKIFGPGNQYVTAAKMLVSKEGIPIDMPAGPSELAIYADDSADPSFVAADLLSQAEHGIDSQVIVVTTSEKLIELVQVELEKQLEALPRKEIAEISLNNSTFVLFRSTERCIDFLNEYAAEHLILSCDNAEEIADQITNAGSIFLGHLTPESCGDYASGTNHTLPTNGYARMYSGVSLDSFVKKITHQRITAEGLNSLGSHVEVMAENEGLHGHKNAVTVRLKKLASE
ncbi:MAG: histidinol dehydrogenase [Spirosomataceae bacterium]|jgi:histidinol dehydrogenase